MEKNQQLWLKGSFDHSHLDVWIILLRQIIPLYGILAQQHGKTSTAKGLVCCSELVSQSFCSLLRNLFKSTSLLYKHTQNQFTVQAYTKPVYCTSVHKTSLLYNFTQNQFTVQVYINLVYCTCVHKLGSYRGQIITQGLEITGMEHYNISGNYRDGKLSLFLSGNYTFDIFL